MIPLEEIYDRALVNTSLVSYWQVPKKTPSLKQIEMVKFERFDVPYIFGRDDNFMLKTKDGKSVVKLYNFYGYEKMDPVDRLMHFMHGESTLFANMFQSYLVHPAEAKPSTMHFRDTFSDVETEYYFFETKEEALENYAMTKATENNASPDTIHIEEQILDTYPEMFV